MTSEHTANVAETAGSSTPSGLGRLLLLVGTPLLLLFPLGFHPHAGQDLFGVLTPVIDTWLLVHVVLLPLFGLFGLCLYVLLQGFSGTVATIGRVGVALYFVFYIAYEAIAGLATGLIVHEAQALPPAQQDGVAEAIQVFFGPTITLALLGTAGTVIAVVAIGILYRRSGAPLVPVTFLAGAPLTALGHGGGPLDVIGLLLFAAGVAWLELGWRRRGERIPKRST